MRTTIRLLVASLLAVFSTALSAARHEAPAASRGQMLYQNHCTECHTSVAHVRSNRRAASVAAVEAWVRRWVEHKKLDWDDTDIAEVTQHLVDHYYRFDTKPPKTRP